MASLVLASSSQCISKEEWCTWLSLNTSRKQAPFCDYGLAVIAEHLGKSSAVDFYFEGVAKENVSDVNGAISLYRKAFKVWPALDSVTCGGLPLSVREEAIAAGLSDILMDVVDVGSARATQVVISKGLLTAADLADIESVRQTAVADQTILENNPENATHFHKENTFLHMPPTFYAYELAPVVIGKMLHFAGEAWEQADWSGTADCPGPLYAVSARGGLPSLSIRVVEHWKYDVGGGLFDPVHYDVDSVLTIVALLNDEHDFDGGCFRTNEPDGSLEHPMCQGDVICFLSHKYHNITALTRGVRKSLVVELWQGGVGHTGR